MGGLWITSICGRIVDNFHSVDNLWISFEDSGGLQAAAVAVIQKPSRSYTEVIHKIIIIIIIIRNPSDIGWVGSRVSFRASRILLYSQFEFTD